jgi:hypothetical protein
MNKELEQQAANYFATLDTDARKDAFERVNASIKLTAPVEDVDPPPPVHDLATYFDMDLKEPPSLVGDCEVVRGEITATVSRAGYGKSTLLAYRMMRWSAGLPLFDDLSGVQVPVKPLRMLLIENEGSGFMLRENMQKLHAHFLPNDEARQLALENMFVWGDGGYSGLKVDNDENLDTIKRALTEHTPDVLMLEPFRGIWTGDENSNSEMEKTLDRLVGLADEFECGIMLSHHANKGPAIEGDWMGMSRGATALEGKAAVMEVFHPIKNNELRELRWVKKRYGRKAPPGPLRVEYQPDTRGLDLVPDSELEQDVLSFLALDAPPQWWSTGQIAEEVGETHERVDKKALRPLMTNEKVVKKNKEGTVKYRLKVGDGDKGEELDF